MNCHSQLFDTFSHFNDKNILLLTQRGKFLIDLPLFDQLLLQISIFFSHLRILFFPPLIVFLQISSFSIKVIAFCWLFMTIRWTLPRFRYDQLMELGWKGIFPIALANIVITAFILLFF